MHDYHSYIAVTDRYIQRWTQRFLQTCIPVRFTLTFCVTLYCPRLCDELNVPTEYAQVVRMLGNGRCESKCFDGTTRLCHIRGKLRKKVWVNAQDIVLVGLRDYQDDKADIILKYSPDEARNLIKYHEIPDTTTINENTGEGEEGEGGEEVVFDFEAIDEI